MNLILNKNEKIGKGILLCGIVGIGFFLRSILLTSRPIWYDEAITVFYAKAGIAFITKHFIHGSNPPFAYYLYAFWIKMFGESQLSFELVSVLFGGLSIFSMYRVGKTLFSDRVGILSSALLACSYYHVFVSQQIRGYSIACFLCLESIYFFWKFYSNKKKYDLIVWLLVSSFALATHFYTVFLVFSQFLIIWRQERLRSFFSRVSVVLFCVALTVSSFIKYLHPDLFPVYPRSAPDGADLFLVLKSALFWVPALMVVSFLLVARLAIRIFTDSDNKKKWSVAFLLLWFVSSVALPYLTSRAGSSFFYIRYYIFSHLAWVLLTAAAIDLLSKRYLVLTFFLPLLSWSLVSYYADSRERYQIRLSYERVGQAFEPGDLILHENGWTFGPSFFYHKGRFPEFFLRDEFGIPNQWNRKVNLDRLSEYKRLWLFIESPDQFYSITQEPWFLNLKAKLIREDTEHLWYLFELKQV